MPEAVMAVANQRVDIEIRVRVANNTATLSAHANVGNKKRAQMSKDDWAYIHHVLDEAKALLVPA